MADQEDGKMGWTIEDDLVKSENGSSCSSSTCERDPRTLLSEQEEAFLLSGLDEIEGLLQHKEEEEATLDLHLDVDDPEVKRNFHKIGQSNWLYDTLHRSKKEPNANVSECKEQETPEPDGESSTQKRLNENNQPTKNYSTEEKCDGDEYLQE